MLSSLTPRFSLYMCFCRSWNLKCRFFVHVAVIDVLECIPWIWRIPKALLIPWGFDVSSDLVRLFVSLSTISELYNCSCHFILWGPSQSESCWWVSRICLWNNSKLVWQCTECLLTCGLPERFLFFLDVGRSFLKSWLGHLWNSVTRIHRYCGMILYCKILIWGGKHVAVISICLASACIGAHESYLQAVRELCCNIHEMFSCGWIELFWHFWRKLKLVETVTNYHGTLFLIIHEISCT